VVNEDTAVEGRQWRDFWKESCVEKGVNVFDGSISMESGWGLVIVQY